VNPASSERVSLYNQKAKESTMQLNPYLTFNGQCEAAFKYYAKVLGGNIEAMIPYKGSPVEEQVPPEFSSKILHARLSVDNGVLMGSDDGQPGRYEEPKGISVALNLSNPADAERIFQALSVNGKVKMPFQETFWAARFGTLVDQFGIPWMLNCEKVAA
jgi:PhnB protein